MILRVLLTILCGAVFLSFGSGFKGAQAKSESGLYVPPEPIKRHSPHYPRIMRQLGTMGGAIVEFIVTKEGKVVEPQSVSETHMALAREAVEAVAKWRFKPGTRNGKPVDARMAVPIYFILNDAGEEDWAGKIRAVITGFPPISPTKVPEGFRYDEAPTPIESRAPVWPWIDGVPTREGKAELFFAINAQGRVTQVKIVSATNEAFGQAAQAALECWKYKPAELDGKPVPALGRKEMQFKLYLPEESADLRLLQAIKKGKVHFAKVSELDVPLRPITSEVPQYPMSLIDERPAGTTVIECIIDRSGRVCLPRIISSSKDAFGWAAATAVMHFRFAPPKMEGKPVDVKVRIPFKFQGRKE